MNNTFKPNSVTSRKIQSLRPQIYTARNYLVQEQMARKLNINIQMNAAEQKQAEIKRHLKETKDMPAKPFIEMDFAEIERRYIASMSVVKIEHHPGFYSADCPQCGKTKILSSELNSLTAVCNKCYCPFLLEK